MNNFHTLDKILRRQPVDSIEDISDKPYDYARAIAAIENAVVVVSDLSRYTNRIFCGQFGKHFGLENNSVESSIWEKEILARMSRQEQDVKFLAELRFFHYLKKLPVRQRTSRYLATKLRITSLTGKIIDVLHRMYYIYGLDGTSVRYAVCVYSPLSFDFAGSSVVVDSTTGNVEELSDESDKDILGPREKQVLVLIDRGHTSADIAALLSISKHTVSRHRQEILAKLHVKNSIEACRVAKSLRII